jgi:hypothetical protein
MLLSPKQPAWTDRALAPRESWGGLRDHRAFTHLRIRRVRMLSAQLHGGLTAEAIETTSLSDRPPRMVEQHAPAPLINGDEMA